jgi:hypothetical protein
MPFLASLVLLAISGGVELVDEVYRVPAADWRYVDLGPIRRPVIVKAAFSVESGPNVLLMLMTSADLERMSHGESYAPLAAVASHNGSFEHRIGPPGDFVVVLQNATLENRASRQPASVHLRILLDYGDATQLSPERRLTVIAISFAVFFGLVGFSANKLWRAAKPRSSTTGP